MAETISRQFAHWAANLSYDELPPAVADKIKGLLLQGLAGAVFGSQTAMGRMAVELTKAEEGKPDGATILTDGSKATRVGAAFANAAMVTYSGLWDSYRMLTHPALMLIPAAMVNAELENKSGKDVITALAAGYELLCRMSADFTPSTAAHGFRCSMIYGALASAMVTGKLLGLDEEGLVAALGIAAHFASGLYESQRAGSNEPNEPQAVRNGIFAAVLARTGKFRGAETAIDGESGFYYAFTGSNKGTLTHAFTGPLQVDMASITEGLGKQYRLLTVMFRMYATAGYNQPVIDLMAEMKQQHSLNADDMAEVAVRMNWIETLYPSPDFPRYPDWNTPRVGGTHYFAAHVAVNGGYPVVGGRTFGPTGARLTEDQRVLDFMRDRVTLVQEKDRPMFSPGIIVTLKDGTKYSGEYPYERMEWNFGQLVERLQECKPGFPLGDAGLDALIEASRNAESLPSVDRLVALTTLP